jgi:hypothetical protein
LGEESVVEIGGAVQSLEEATMIADSLLADVRLHDQRLRRMEARDQHGRVVRQRHRGTQTKARSP